MPNIRYLSGIFYNFSSLKELPYISKWNLSKVGDSSEIFGKCSSLKEFPDISKWNLMLFTLSLIELSNKIVNE